VSRFTAGGQFEPQGAFLCHRDRHYRLVHHPGEPVGPFAQHVGGRASVAEAQELGMVLEHPLRTLVASRLLVRGHEHDHLARRRSPRTGERGHRFGVHDRNALHVEGTASPHRAVVDLPSEGISRPSLALDRDHVRM
jgi:hypothetical protein